MFRLESVGPMGSTEVCHDPMAKMMRRRLTWLVPIASLDPLRLLAQMDYSDDKDVLEIFECEQALRNSCVPTVSCFRSDWDRYRCLANSDASS